jgi:hypothetical protein
MPRPNRAVFNNLMHLNFMLPPLDEKLGHHLNKNRPGKNSISCYLGANIT